MIRINHIISIILIIFGGVTAFIGAVQGGESIINAGVGGIFLGVVVLSFSTSEYIKYDAFEAVLSPYFQLSKKLIDVLDMKNKAIYIPSYGNLPEGGVFIPLHENFDLDLAKVDDDSFFITDVGREREMGLFLKPLGKDLMQKYEAYSEMNFTNAGLHAVQNASTVLRSLGLANSVDIVDKDDEIVVKILGVKTKICSKACEQISCPVCNSILLSIAESIQELIIVKSFTIRGENVEIKAKRMGGINKWM